MADKKPSHKTPKVSLDTLADVGYRHLQGQPTDDFTIREFQGGRAIKLIREMVDHSPIVGAALLAIEHLVRRVKWEVDPGADQGAMDAAQAKQNEANKPPAPVLPRFVGKKGELPPASPGAAPPKPGAPALEDPALEIDDRSLAERVGNDNEDLRSRTEARAKVLDGMKDDMSVSWADTVPEILTMIPFGWAFLETVYKIRRGPDEKDGRYRSTFSDSLVAWRKWVLVPQETMHGWNWDDDGGLESLIQLSPVDYKQIEIPIGKGLLFRTRATKNNPQGRSLLLNAFYPYLYAKRIQETEAVGVERDLSGLPMALIPPEYLDPNADADQQAMLAYIKKLVTGVRRNQFEGIIFPQLLDSESNPLFEFKLLTTGGMRQFDTGKIIERYERRIAMSLLADMIMLGHEKSGSFALSEGKETLLGRAIEGILLSIKEIINRHGVPRIYQLNGWELMEGETYAAFVPRDLEAKNLKDVGMYIKNLVGAGAITADPELEAWCRSYGNLPKIDKDYVRGPNEMPGFLPEAPEEVDENGEPIEPDEDDDTPTVGAAEGAPPEPAKKPKKPKKQKAKDYLSLYRKLVA